MVRVHVERSRVLERYRFFFKIIGVVFALSITLTLSGLARALFLADTTWFGMGLLLLAFTGLSGYRVVLSTMRIIEEDAREHGWERYSA
jgi:hypothetical protein